MALQILFYVFLFTIGTCHASVYEVDAEKVKLFFTHQPQDVVAVKGNPLLLDCAFNNDVEVSPNVTWFHNGQPLPVPDFRRTVLHNGSLFFEKVLHKRSGRNTSDEGMYHCLLRTDAGVVTSRNASLRIAGLAQEFTEIPLDTVAVEGDAARFECQIVSAPEAQITWEKDDQMLETRAPNGILNVTGNVRFVAFPNGVLHIHQVRLSDAGSYRCVVTNTLLGKSRRSPAGNFSVTPRRNTLRPPQFLMDDTSVTNNKTIALGKDVILECLATGNPPPTITWTVNSTKINEIPGEITAHPGYLYISRANVSATGFYNCTASDNSTTISKFTELRVTVPPFIITAPKSQVFPTAKTVRFDCEVGGYPVPVVRWLKDGRSLSGDGRVIQRLRNAGTLSELVLSNTVTTDSGFYQCIAQNVGGIESSVARLLVNASEGRPEPPFNLKAVALSASQVQLTWNPPRNVPVSDITAYTVHYMLADGAEELLKVALNNSFIFDRLRPNTSYTFYVRAYSTKSASDQSERITVRTLSENLLPYSNVTLTAVNPTSLKASWTRNFENQQGLQKIQYRLHNEDYIHMEPVRSDANEYVITGLHPGKKYDVRILSGSPLDLYAPWSTQEMPRRRSSAPLLYLTTNDQRSIQVTWEERKQAKGYKLLLRKAGGRFKEHATIPSTSEKAYVINGLNADTNYDIQLVAFGENGEGPASVKSIRTLGDSDDIDADATYDNFNLAVKIEAVTSKSASVSWQVEADNIDIAFFTVRYHIKLGDERREGTFYVRTTTLEAKLANLKPFTVYEANLQFHDSRGRFSSFSLPVEFRTLPDAPSAPLHLTATVGSNSITVSWQPPLEANGVIVTYEVFFTDNSSLPIDRWFTVEESGYKYRSALQNLLPDRMYYIKIRAKNEAGYGSFTDTVEVDLYSGPLEDFHNQSGSSEDSAFDQQMGIILGLGLGIGILLASTLVVLWRARCMKRVPLRRTQTPSDGLSAPGESSGNAEDIVRASGNGFYRSALEVKKKPAKRNRKPPEEHVSTLEMETLTPILSNIPSYINEHLDTKGGYPSAQAHGSFLDGPTGRHLAQPLLRIHGKSEPVEEDHSEAVQEGQIRLEMIVRNLGHCSSHSSLQSIGACSDEGRLSGNSLRSWSDDNDTGICSVGPYGAGGSVLRCTGCLSTIPVRESEELVT